MPRIVRNALGEANYPETPVPVANGGTGAATPEQALNNLGALSALHVNQPGGPVSLDRDGHIDPAFFGPLGIAVHDTVIGPAALIAGEVAEYQITDYDVFSTYDIVAQAGTVLRVDDMITYTAPAVAGNSGFTINGKVCSITILNTTVSMPSISAPVNGSVEQPVSPTLYGSVYHSSLSGDSHMLSDWQIASDAAFANIVAQSLGDAMNLTQWKAPALPYNTTVYARVRYKSASGHTSAWSQTVSFKTLSTHIASVEQAKLTGDPIEAADSFGHAVAISADGSTAVIGASWANESGISHAGVLYVYVNNGGIWAQQAKFTATDVANGDAFGSSVSISADGNTVIVASNVYVSNNGTVSTGAAYIFTRSGTTWTQQAKLTASDKAAGDMFGYSVAISSTGDIAIVGAYAADVDGVVDCGAAYIFTRTGTVWTEQTKLIASDKASSDYFGCAVSLSSDGNTIAIGAYQADPDTIHEAGAAYIFVYNGTSWVQQAKLIASDKTTGDYLGYSVSLSGDGNTLVVGAWKADIGSNTDVGAAYVFTRNGTAWAQEAKLTASDAAASDQFSWAVSISSDGKVIAVGAYLADHNGIVDSGAVYLYTKAGAAWTQQKKLVASDASTLDYFGNSLALNADGSIASIGAFGASPSGFSQAGAAYIFA